MMSRIEDGCIKCGTCQNACPVFRIENYPYFQGPRRIAVEAPRFSRELTSLSDSPHMCTSCALCESVCPSRLPITEAVLKMRTHYGIESEGGRRMISNINQYGRTIAPTSKFTSPVSGSTLFFPGCIGDARVPSAVQGAVDMLIALGDQVYIPNEWYCCGSPLEKIGAKSEVDRLQEMNSAILGTAERIVTACPGCTFQLQKNSNVDVLHVLEHLFEVITPSRLRWRSTNPINVALHSPCHLVRSVGPHTMDYAREILGSIAGVRVIDMDDEGCCGGGGGVTSTFPEMALKMARLRVESAIRAGAHMILAPCPFCVVNLRRVGDLEVKDLTAFLTELSLCR
ncbi:MAG: 4Fe-4S dicluster domain-containing protein [Euryarchaeota archaeon]|nr:4Fe-4S dicluster domain-containing protein [Euryarchaeota archaeon]